MDAGPSLVLVDAGCGQDTARLVANIAGDGLDPALVSDLLITHAHFDHAAGAAALSRALPRDLSVATSHAEADLLEGGSGEDLGLPTIGLAGRSREDVFPVIRVDRRIGHGEVLSIGRLRITALVTPGHNPGCVCWLVELDGRRMLFSGDVVFTGGYISVGNWRTCDPRAYREGLGRLAGLGIDALLCGHHLWTLEGGQAHIDRALKEFDGLWPPPSLHTIRG
jgi:glyoxylase-like metal-dependent hydrolase (beta-lactamase superfamily II)